MEVAQVRTDCPGSIRLFGELTTFSHSIFALPFALSMVVIVTRTHSISIFDFLWILVCVVTARTSAMAWNRYLDAEIDALNPRTCGRPVPRGAVSKRYALVVTIASGTAFVASSAVIGLHCAVLAPLVLVLLLGYSAMKRISAGAHLVLGFALACAPGGVWYALTGTFSWIPVPLMVGVALWVCGFDILYSCQDSEFDRKEGLHSIPSKFGVARALIFARTAHAIAFVFFCGFGLVADMGVAYYLGVTAFGLIVTSQHFVISATNVSQIGRAFFTRNGVASFVFLLAVLVDRWG